MTEKQSYLYSDPSGVIKIMPAETMPLHIFSDAPRKEDSAMYQAALQRAKEQAVTVADQDTAWRKILCSIGVWVFDSQASIEGLIKTYNNPNTIYGPFSLRYEIEGSLTTHDLVGMFMHLPTHEKIGICNKIGYDSTYYGEGKTLQDSDKDFFKWVYKNNKIDELKSVVPPLFERWHERAYQQPYKPKKVAILHDTTEKKTTKVKCNCSCHRNPGVKHVVECCDNGWIEVDTPEKEESHETLWREVDRIFNVSWNCGMPDDVMQELKEKFTITRKQ